MQKHKALTLEQLHGHPCGDLSSFALRGGKIG
jgi:hypothetical protein